MPETRSGNKSKFHKLLLVAPVPFPGLYSQDGRRKPEAPSRPTAQRYRSGATRLGLCVKRTLSLSEKIKMAFEKSGSPQLDFSPESLLCQRLAIKRSKCSIKF